MSGDEFTQLSSPRRPINFKWSKQGFKFLISLNLNDNLGNLISIILLLKPIAPLLVKPTP